MAKRAREEDFTPSQVIVDERGAKRHAAEGAWVLPENQQLPGALRGLEVLPASKLHASLPGVPVAGEPLRPVNHDAGSVAMAGHSSLEQHLAEQQPDPQQQQQAQQAQQQQQQQQQQHQEQQAQQQQAVAALAELGSGFSTHIDWHNPEHVAALLRALHWERLQRQGVQPPAGPGH